MFSGFLVICLGKLEEDDEMEGVDIPDSPPPPNPESGRENPESLMDLAPNGTGSGGLKLELHWEFMVIVGPSGSLAARIFLQENLNVPNSTRVSSNSDT